MQNCFHSTSNPGVATLFPLFGLSGCEKAREKSIQVFLFRKADTNSFSIASGEQVHIREETSH